MYQKRQEKLATGSSARNRDHAVIEQVKHKGCKKVTLEVAIANEKGVWLF